MKRYKDLVNSKKLKVSLDLSTYCNAACPQCHRTSTDGLGKVDWLPLIKWSLEDFKRQFPEDSMNSLKRFEICGTWGDPMMSKDIGKLAEKSENRQDRKEGKEKWGEGTPASIFSYRYILPF